jgi:hypothetical protein
MRNRKLSALGPLSMDLPLCQCPAGEAAQGFPSKLQTHALSYCSRDFSHWLAKAFASNSRTGAGREGLNSKATLNSYRKRRISASGFGGLV